MMRRTDEEEGVKTVRDQTNIDLLNADLLGIV